MIHIFRWNLIKHIINLQHLVLIVSCDISIKVWSLRFHLRKAGDMITKRITNKRSSWSMFPTGCTKTEKIYIKENNKKKKWKIVRVMPSAFFLFIWNDNSKLKMYSNQNCISFRLSIIQVYRKTCGHWEIIKIYRTTTQEKNLVDL